MQLEEFYDYKNQLMDDLLTNAEIIRLLDDNYKDSDQPERFVYSQVFPLNMYRAPLSMVRPLSAVMWMYKSR